MSIGEVKSQVHGLLDQVDDRAKQAMALWHEMHDALAATTPILGYENREAQEFSDPVLRYLIQMFHTIEGIEGTVKNFKQYIQSK